MSEFLCKNNDRTAQTFASSLADLTIRKKAVQDFRTSTELIKKGATTANDKNALVSALGALSNVIAETCNAAEMANTFIKSAFGLSKQVSQKKCVDWEVGGAKPRPRHEIQERPGLKPGLKKAARAMIKRRVAAVGGRDKKEMDLSNMALDDMDVDDLLKRAQSACQQAVVAIWTVEGRINRARIPGSRMRSTVKSSK